MLPSWGDTVRTLDNFPAMARSKSERRTLLVSFMFMLPLCISCGTLRGTISENPQDGSQSPLPPNFLFGTSSSSYQYEGAYLSDGKGLSNWDIFAHEPGRVIDGSNGDVAVDQYHRYQEDVGLMQDMGVDVHRFSFSWARILPKGRFGEINLKGIDYYNRLIDALLSKEIKPFATLAHYDLPQELEDRYGGWLSPEAQTDFAYYADICFKHFGDRVKYWLTMNEPNYQATFGYLYGTYPPGRCSKPFGNCTDGDSQTEPFIAAHNLILGHAAAVELYRTKYQKEQEGTIGVAINTFWFEPISNSTLDILAAKRAQAYYVAWLLDPIMFGRYPEEMEQILGSNLPKFSIEDKKKLRNALDFIGINYYTGYYVRDCLYSTCESETANSIATGFYDRYSGKDGIQLGKHNRNAVYWLNVYPEGMEKTVHYIKDRYNNTPMFIIENGYGEELPNCTVDQMEECINDYNRIEYMSVDLDALMRTIRNGADVRGYMVWSLMDNFEWTYGYTVRFGLHHVDYATLQRTPRLSARWYKEFIAKHRRTTTYAAAAR